MLVFLENSPRAVLSVISWRKHPWPWLNKTGHLFLREGAARRNLNKWQLKDNREGMLADPRLMVCRLRLLQTCNKAKWSSRDYSGIRWRKYIILYCFIDFSNFSLGLSFNSVSKKILFYKCFTHHSTMRTWISINRWVHIINERGYDPFI